MSAAPATGDALGPHVVASVSADAMRGLAAVLQDPNAIHLEADVVRRLGLGDRVINQGPANCSYVVTMLRAAFPGATIRALSFQLLGNVFAGDRVVAAGRIEAVETGPDGRVVQCHCRAWLDVDGGTRAVEATATIVLAEP
jgi:3-hydroxybutyryl-CoA dehydratase